MSNVPHHCVVCHTIPRQTIWNGLTIFECPQCKLAWRTTFDLPNEYYQTLHQTDAGPSTEKKEARRRDAEDRLRMIRPYLSNGIVIDIGCGDGSFVHALHNAGYTTAGLEPDQALVKRAVADGLPVTCGTIEDVPHVIGGRHISAATLFHVIEHLPEPKRALTLLARILPHDSILVIETPDNEAPLQRVTHHVNDLVYREHLFYWSEQALRKALEQSGFIIVKVARRSFDWRYMPIRASLTRLSFFRYSYNKASELSTHPSVWKMPTGHSSFPNTPQTDSFARRATRALLAQFVHAFGRDDHILMLAKRV